MKNLSISHQDRVLGALSDIQHANLLFKPSDLSSIDLTKAKEDFKAKHSNSEEKFELIVENEQFKAFCNGTVFENFKAIGLLN